MKFLKHGQWTVCAVALLAGIVWLGNPSSAHASHQMGPAFNQSLTQTVDQVMALIQQAQAQNQNIPALNRALSDLTSVLEHEGNHHKNDGHRHGGRDQIDRRDRDRNR